MRVQRGEGMPRLRRCVSPQTIRWLVAIHYTLYKDIAAEEDQWEEKRKILEVGTYRFVTRHGVLVCRYRSMIVE